MVVTIFVLIVETQNNQQSMLQYNFSYQMKQFQIVSMTSVKVNKKYTSYLDVSQFIIKEHSPLIEPIIPQPSNNLQENINNQTPQINPIDHDASQFTLTPLNHALIFNNTHQKLQEFCLDYQQQQSTRKKHQIAKNKTKKFQLLNFLHLDLMKMPCDLERIIQEDRDQLQDECESSSDQQQDLEDSNQQIVLKDPINTASSLKTINHKQVEQQKQSTIDILAVDYTQIISLYSKNPKVELLKKIREIEHDASCINDTTKRQNIKQIIQSYLLEYQFQQFQQFWKTIVGTKSLKSMCILLAKKIEETFSKIIANLPFQIRRIKLLKYLQKKHKRIWKKKVSYDCRKKVADGRLRIKGKFVTREQACNMLGLENLDNYSPEQIKELLQKKSEESLNQPITC